MSGICGIWNLDGQPVERALLSRMSATLSHRGPDGEGLWAEGPAGMACQHLQITPESVGQPQPLIHAAGTVLVFDGRLDNRDELLHGCADEELSARSTDTALVLAAYHAYGEAFAERLNGDFALGLFDPMRQRLILVRDALGVRPLYYCRLDGLLLFASEIKTLLAHPRVNAKPDRDSLSAYLIGPRPTLDSSGRTLFEGIFSVPPAHKATQTPAGFAIDRYWDFDPQYQTRFTSPADYAAAFRHFFEQAVRRRLRSAAPVAVSVSGGLDSSSIFCTAQMLRQGAGAGLPACHGISYTSTGGAADERAYLDEIEGKYRCHIERVPLTPAGFAEGARASIWYTEDPLIDTQATFGLHFRRRVRATGARVLLTGHWGDQVLAGTDHLIDLFHKPAWRQLATQLKELPRWEMDAAAYHSHSRAFLRELLRHHIPDAWLPALRALKAALRSGRAGKSHSLFSEKVRLHARCSLAPARELRPRFASRYAAALYEQARKPFNVECMEWNNKMAAMDGSDMAFPFLDRDLLSFLMSIPGDMAQRAGVARWILREGMAGVLPESIRNRRWKADFTQVANQGACQELHGLMEQLGSGSRVVAGEFVDSLALRQQIARLEKSDPGASHALSAGLGSVFGLELWLSTFFETL